MAGRAHAAGRFQVDVDDDALVARWDDKLLLALRHQRPQCHRRHHLQSLGLVDDDCSVVGDDTRGDTLDGGQLGADDVDDDDDGPPVMVNDGRVSAARFRKVDRDT